MLAPLRLFPQAFAPLAGYTAAAANLFAAAAAAANPAPSAALLLLAALHSDTNSPVYTAKYKP